MLYRKAEDIPPESYISISINSFLKNGYVFFKTRYKGVSVQEIFLKGIPSSTLSTIMTINIPASVLYNARLTDQEEYADGMFVIDVSRIKSIREYSDMFYLEMKNDSTSTPTAIPKIYLDRKDMASILKRLGRFDLLLQIEG